MALVYNKEFNNELTSSDGKFTIKFGDEEEENDVNEFYVDDENEDN